ncbi:DNA-binding transcriptional regulator, IscR family [Vibrio xiamenensis]|uniref:DNA-binding transcriptional regulator, IscR family n=1 Tax=Vibrio xiamenensis TaxID=861298 RepID=A0A1G8ARW0_9VIBR|nr:Rrf2 family transcriptional regulator [Vibrio xiamenensis]SDH23792.1 DNA-binding transcriptional regulator, IscR family [Vibrio xiamenensis]
MRIDSRLSRVLHIILHMAREDKPMNSEHFAKMLGTNSAVIRRTMAGLREAGYLASVRGQKGGWQIACDLNTVTLLDIYQAVGKPTVFCIGFDNNNPDCVVEKAVNAAIREALQASEALLLKRFSEITLSELSEDFIERYAAY